MSIAQRYNTLHLLALLSLAVGLLAGGGVRAQDNAADFEALVGPVALYPDDLLAIVLPASSYPLQVVQAARFLEERKNDPDLKPDDEWDDAVVALLNYPEVVAQMNDDLDWTWALGEAFINEQTATMDAIQQFRERARLAGNLNSDDHQVVHEVEGAIEIEPADPQVIYVPYYEPTRVVVRHYRPVYSYYPRAYPVYYYPYGYGYTFADDLFWGVTTHFAFNWISHSLHARHYSHYRHPYRGYTYRRPLYTRHYLNSHRVTGRFAHNDVWRPTRRHGARPRHGVRTWRSSGFARGDRRFNNNRNRSVQQPRNRAGSRRVTNNRAQRRVNRDLNRNQNRSSFAPRNAAPRRRSNPTQNRVQNRSAFAPSNSPSQRAAPRQQRRNNMANTKRSVAPRQQRAAPNRARQNRAAPRRATPSQSRQQARRTAPSRAAPNRTAPGRAAPNRSRSGSRAEGKFAARSGSRRR